MRPVRSVRTWLLALLTLAFALGVSVPVLAGPFFSQQVPGSLSPASWADVTRYVTYSSPVPRFIIWRITWRLAPQPAPAPAPAPAPSPQPVPEPIPAPQPPAPGLTADERSMVDLVNQERAAVGLPPLQVDMELVKLARLKSQDMVTHNYFAHESPTYGSPFAMMDRAGISYRYAGENLAGAPTVAQAHRALMASPGHRANILNRNFTHVGIGIAKGGPYGYMYTQMFVGR